MSAITAQSGFIEKATENIYRIENLEPVEHVKIGAIQNHCREIMEILGLDRSDNNLKD